MGPQAFGVFACRLLGGCRWLHLPPTQAATQGPGIHWAESGAQPGPRHPYSPAGGWAPPAVPQRLPWLPGCKRVGNNPLFCISPSDSLVGFARTFQPWVRQGVRAQLGTQALCVCVWEGGGDHGSWSSLGSLTKSRRIRGLGPLGGWLAPSSHRDGSPAQLHRGGRMHLL